MKIAKVGICGAGTMGAGIAQVFAQAGFETILFDVSQPQLDTAIAAIQKNWDKAIEKNKLTELEKEQATQRLHTTNAIEEVQADLVIEAIVEKLDVKRDLFTKLSAINSTETIFASNTSSLSITKIATGMSHPERFAGIHFFNPAPIMKLVEIICGAETNTATTTALTTLSKSIGKNPVVCKDAPGFIVNRVARHYYVESLKILEEQAASMENIDLLLESAGFKMGAFKLMDVIGNDINFAVTSSLFEAFHGDAKFRPSRIQAQKVDAKQLGKKTGKGFYQY